MKKILSIVAIALVAITSAYAQEDNNRDENGAVVRGPYLTNGFWDNWFVSAAGGANFTVSKETKFSFGGPALDLNIGKWFTPAVGFRFGLHGLNNSFDLKPGHTTLIDNGNGNFEFFQYIQEHANRIQGGQHGNAQLRRDGIRDRRQPFPGRQTGGVFGIGIPEKLQLRFSVDFQHGGVHGRISGIIQIDHDLSLSLIVPPPITVSPS